jgi:hypothetical protein
VDSVSESASPLALDEVDSVSEGASPLALDEVDSVSESASPLALDEVDSVSEGGFRFGGRLATCAGRGGAGRRRELGLRAAAQYPS